MTKGNDVGKLFEIVMKARILNSRMKIREKYFLLFSVLVSSIIELAMNLLQI